MRIITDPDQASSARLAEADDFTRFSVVARAPADPDRLRRGIGSLGRSEGEHHVFVDPEALRELPGARPDDERWSTSLDAMLQFAR